MQHKIFYKMQIRKEARLNYPNKGIHLLNETPRHSPNTFD